jgi:GxxExxY protein
MNELGTGFLEQVYKNALIVSLQQKGMFVEIEKIFEVFFREQRIGFYRADLVVEKSIIVELKCCKCLLAEHQAQVINYLKASGILTGLLVNLGNKKVEFKRLYHPSLALEQLELYSFLEETPRLTF